MEISRRKLSFSLEVQRSTVGNNFLHLGQHDNLCVVQVIEKGADLDSLVLQAVKSQSNERKQMGSQAEGLPCKTPRTMWIRQRKFNILKINADYRRNLIDRALPCHSSIQPSVIDAGSHALWKLSFCRAFSVEPGLLQHPVYPEGLASFLSLRFFLMNFLYL